MSLNRADSFFSVPDTPPTNKSEKGQWELPSTNEPPTSKMTPQEAEIYNRLMADTDSDSTESPPRKMSPGHCEFYKEVTGHSYESDSSVEVLNDKQVARFQNKMSKQTDVVERAFKRCKKSRDYLNQNSRAKIAMFYPQMTDTRLTFVRDHFAGVGKIGTTRAVDTNGMVYKRVILRDGTFASHFVVSAEQLLFKIDGEKVQHKTPGARGIVNISRTNRVPFDKLYIQTFDNEKF